MPVNYTGNHELLGHARNALINAFGECVLSAMDTDAQGKAQAQFTISTATQLAYLDSITPDEED